MLSISLANHFWSTADGRHLDYVTYRMVDKTHVDSRRTPFYFLVRNGQDTTGMKRGRRDRV